MAISETRVEKDAVQMLQEQGYVYLSPDRQLAERDTTDVVFRDRLKAAIDKLNPNIPAAAKEQALREVLNLPHANPIDNNEAFHRLLNNGVAVEYQKNGETKGDIVWLIDFENPRNNDLLVCSQFVVKGHNTTRRPDVVLLVNGLPLVVMELKNPADEKASMHKAFVQLQNYQQMIPALFNYNGVLVVSDGCDAKMGSLTSEYQRFMAWKTIDGQTEAAANTPQYETLIKGMLRPDVLLDLLRHFTVLEKTGKADAESGQIRVFTQKKIAAYHQYYAVTKAVESTLRASGTAQLSHPDQPLRDRKAGVVWHTQGSGKSLSMVFYAGKIVLAMNNPTIVVITDRNDLDSQLFDTFAGSHDLLRQAPQQASNRAQLRQYLTTAGGGIVFTTIQKFFPEDEREHFGLLSARENIVVIADEAHRSQYGFGAATRIKNDEARTRYGFAKYLRDALPNASFIGFTGTPIEKEKASTTAVFGDYIDIYDIARSVADGATVPIYYESRLVKVHLKEEQKAQIDAEMEDIIEEEESSASEKAKRKWASVAAIVGHRERLGMVAADLIDHFEQRQQVAEGKGMIVTMSRHIAVALYEEIIKHRPAWHDPDQRQCALRVIMTAGASDPPNWQQHHTTKHERKELGARFKSPNDPLQLVIVCDMWLTGFDVPCLHTMYMDKPLRGHNLMQAIARVNRVYKDKQGGLIVDYIGVASDLKQAVQTYSESGGQGQPTFDYAEAIAAMIEKHEIVAQMFNLFNYKRYFAADTREKLKIILEAQEHILRLSDDGVNRFIKHVTALAKVFALAVPAPAAIKIRDEVGFFLAIKARLVKFERSPDSSGSVAMETAIRQIVEQAIVGDEVIDVFASAGIKKPDFSILSDEFLQEIRDMKLKNVALALLTKLLHDEIKSRGKKNVIQSRNFSEMLEEAIRKYQNKLLTVAEVINELITLAKAIRHSAERGKKMGLSDDEIAFYDALANNDSARDVLGDKKLRSLAQVLVIKVKTNTRVDWTIRENVQAKLRIIVRNTLRRHGYPPDEAKLATDNVLRQAELFANDWAAAA